MARKKTNKRVSASGLQSTGEGRNQRRAVASAPRRALRWPKALGGGRSSWRYVHVWIIALVAASAAAIVQLTLHFQNVEMGYELNKARREHQRLMDQTRLLSIEAATLRDPARVEAVARGALGLDEPEPERVVVVGAPPRKAVSGELR